MKSTFRQACCFFLIASLLLQFVPMAQAQPFKASSPLSGVTGELFEARRILSQDTGAKGCQNATIPLDRAKQMVKDPSFVRSFPGLASDLQQGIEKARLKVLWNDRNEALMIVNRLLGLVDSAAKKPAPQTPCGNGPGAGAAFGVTVIAGLGAVGAILVALFFGVGQVSHR
ncbi:MAG TPA: hypothetical protein PKM25_01890 [Candidatus Ozemobacteraceae bacterium]|nr:hypothetical protein [Candidatus Ozemobacteraceae bacterium]